MIFKKGSSGLFPPPPHLDPRMAWMQSEDGHCYVLLDLVQTVCIKKMEKFSLEHQQWINIRPDAVHMQIKSDLFMSGLIYVQTDCKSNNQLFNGEDREPVKGRQLMIRHKDMYPFLYKVVRYKNYKIQIIRLKIRIRISTSGSRSGPIKFWHCMNAT